MIIINLIFSSLVYADDIDDMESLNWEEDVIESSNNKEDPRLNSRAAIIYDRKSK